MRKSRNSDGRQFRVNKVSTRTGNLHVLFRIFHQCTLIHFLHELSKLETLKKIVPTLAKSDKDRGNSKTRNAWKSRNAENYKF